MRMKSPSLHSLSICCAFLHPVNRSIQGIVINSAAGSSGPFCNGQHGVPGAWCLCRRGTLRVNGEQLLLWFQNVSKKSVLLSTPHFCCYPGDSDDFWWLSNGIQRPIRQNHLDNFWSAEFLCMLLHTIDIHYLFHSQMLSSCHSHEVQTFSAPFAEFRPPYSFCRQSHCEILGRFAGQTRCH